MVAIRLELPTRKGVPQWLGLVTMFLIFIPASMMNGAYTGTMVEVSGTLGILSEDITMGYYAATVGMCIVYPIIPRLRVGLTPKTLLLLGLIVQVVLNLICARTRSIDVLIIASFLIGAAKGVLMLTFITLVKPFFTPGNIRSEFYAYFYPLVFSGAQLSMVLTAELAYQYQWQHIYYFIAILCLIAILFVLLFFRYSRRPVHIPWREIDLRSQFLIAIAWLAAIYLFTYGKTLDWFASGKLQLLAVMIPVLVWLFLFRQRTARHPFISLEPLKRHKSLIGYFYMAVTMFLTASGSILTSYMNSILHLDSIHVNALNLWLLPGFVLGAVICFWWFRWQRWRFRYLISGGMFCYVAYLALLYFGVSADATYEALFGGMVLRGAGMIILFIAFGLYVVEDLDMKFMLSNAFFLISFRSLLAPVLSASFYSNMLYRLQARGMAVLSETMRMDNPLAAQRYSQSLTSALAQGHGYSESAKLAANGLYSTLQQQALMAGIKQLLGCILIAALVIAVASAFIPFHKTFRKWTIRTGDDMV